MMFNFLMVGVAWSLKVSNTEEDYADYDMCSQDFEDLAERDRIQPWRVRAVCNQENSDRLEEYLEISNRETLSLEQETSFEGKKKRCNKKCKKKERDAKKRINDAKGLDEKKGSKLYQGKFCGQSDPVWTSGLPIANFSYGYNATQNSSTLVLDRDFKSGKKCYELDCTGRCDMVDPSVYFECVAKDSTETEATASKLKATWFLTSGCKAATGTDADGVYHYSKEEVAMVNGGSQDRFCFDASGEATTQDDKNMVVQPEFSDVYYYQYSAISNQKLPVCPR